MKVVITQLAAILDDAIMLMRSSFLSYMCFGLARISCAPPLKVSSFTYDNKYNISDTVYSAVYMIYHTRKVNKKCA